MQRLHHEQLVVRIGSQHADCADLVPVGAQVGVERSDLLRKPSQVVELTRSDRTLDLGSLVALLVGLVRADGCCFADLARSRQLTIQTDHVSEIVDRTVRRLRAATDQTLRRAQRVALLRILHVGEQGIAHDAGKLAPIVRIPFGNEHHARGFANSLQDAVVGRVARAESEDVTHRLPRAAQLELVRQRGSQLLVRRRHATHGHAAAAEFGFDELPLFLQRDYLVDLGWETG